MFVGSAMCECMVIRLFVHIRRFAFPENLATIIRTIISGKTSWVIDMNLPWIKMFKKYYQKNIH